MGVLTYRSTYFTEGRTDLEKQLDPLGSVPVFLKKPIATYDFQRDSDHTSPSLDQCMHVHDQTTTKYGHTTITDHRSTHDILVFLGVASDSHNNGVGTCPLFLQYPMAQVYKSRISLTFTVAMVIKMAAKIGWK